MPVCEFCGNPANAKKGNVWTCVSCRSVLKRMSGEREVQKATTEDLGQRLHPDSEDLSKSI